MENTATREDTALLIVDLQDKLISTISGADRLLINIEALIKTAKIHEIPILLTEQEKLGETVPEIKGILKDFNSYNPIRKLSFSCYRNKKNFLKGNFCAQSESILSDSGEKFRRILERINRSNLLICGIETHICVSQSAIDLMKNDYKVQIPKDATSSHTKEDFEIAIERLREYGAVITTTEALIYELTEKAGTSEFKKILELIKDRRNRMDKIV